jgi:branched-chain amino acid transport system substrate-binding protein
MNKTVVHTAALLVSFSWLLTACHSSKSKLSDVPRGRAKGDRTASPNTTVASATPNSATAIPIGAAFSQTSNYALLAQESVVGAKIAEKYFNDKGGINGTPIKLVFQDTGGDEAGAINAFQTLINQDRVVGIVGPSSSQQAFSADPIAQLPLLLKVKLYKASFILLKSRWRSMGIMAGLYF